MPKLTRQTALTGAQARSFCHASGIVRLALFAGFVVGWTGLQIGAGLADDRHIGYYYPAPQSSETYQAPLPTLPGVSRLSRVGFVTQLDQLQKEKPYPPAYHMFVKGGDAQKLIITATEAGRYDTLFRLRGLLASMTADARTSPLFQKLGHVEQLNFFDLLRMAGFTQLTVTNGNDIAHQVKFK